MASAARKPTPVLEPVIPANLIDEYGELAKLREDFAPTERKYRKALDALKALVADADPDSAFVARGERYTLHVSAQGYESKPNVERVRKLLKLDAFMKVVTITKAALSNWLLKPQIEAVCDLTQTGHRAFAAIPVADAGAAAAEQPIETLRAPAASETPRLKKERA